MDTGTRLKGTAVPSNLGVNLNSNQNKLSIKNNILLQVSTIVTSFFCWLKYLALGKKQLCEEGRELKQLVRSWDMAPLANSSSTSLRVYVQIPSTHKRCPGWWHTL